MADNAAAPELQLPFKEGQVLLSRGQLDRVVLRIIRLDKHFARQRASPSASGNLREQLKRAFSRAEIRQAELRIRGDDSHQRNALKIVSLGHHLRADENIDFPGSKISKHLLVRALGADRVAVEA